MPFNQPSSVSEVAVCVSLGGITPQNAKTYLDAGASHVIVTSYIFKDAKVSSVLVDASVRIGVPNQPDVLHADGL